MIKEALSPEWKKQMFDLEDEEDVAQQIAYDILRGRGLSQIDGFAHMSDNLVKIENYDEDVEAERIDK